MAVPGELEQAVMEILWASPERLSVRDVHERLRDERDLAYTTVMTVLDRLAKKGLATRHLAGRAWVYRPTRSRADEVTAVIVEVLERLDPASRADVLAAVNAAFE